ncbi:RHS repeat-associated core domain-containing protein [Streptomyces sp. 1222.5]|uniref:RHS repeat-associated core domain-containing protein n=1 Tax=Streptomyces sp. 1222.5 TaxID=1881026 RepID=UPI003D754B0A
MAPQQALAAADDPTPVVPSQSLGSVAAQSTEEVGKALPAPKWPVAAAATLDLSTAAPGEPATVSPSPSASTSEDAEHVQDVVEVAPVAQTSGATAQLTAERLAEDEPTPTPSTSASPEPSTSPTAEASTDPSPSASPTAPEEPAADPVSPDQVEVRVLDRGDVEPAGGIGMGLEVTRTDGVQAAGQVQVAIDYSGFKYAYGADFASRLRLVKLPECALQTPQEQDCTDREFVPADNDTTSGTLTATVTAAADTDTAGGVSTQLMWEAGTAGASVYALTTSSSSDAGDYRASTLSPTGSWEVATGSGAFTYNLPIQLPKPPMGAAPSLAMSYNSQSVDGRTSASNNQASWSGMGWDLNLGYIERRYRNCTEDGLPTIGDMCWDSPNSAKEPSGAVYVINLNGVTSELVQDNNGTGSYHVQDDPGWRVQRLFNGYGAGRDGEYWVISSQDGHRYYFGWGRSERTGTATASVFTEPVVGNNTGEPCHDQFPEPCTQAWRWNLDRAVDANEVETMYFYDKEYNHYRSVANTDKAREYVSSGYVKEIQYGWSSQIPNAKVPAKVELTHVNRCIERVQENDPLRDPPATCPTFDDKPTSYPDVPVDLMCDGTSADYNCAGKTYYPTFFSTDMLWDIKTYVSDQDGTGWDLVEQYQNKYGMPNPDGTIGKTLWLDYVQRKMYGSAGSDDDIVLPVINFNRVDLDNKVGSAELNLPRIQEIHGDLGATTTVSYGFANACDASNLPTQASNTQDCFWQKWTPEGEKEAKSGWFKKFLVTQVQVDPTVTTNQDGAPEMTTSYTYEDGAGWRFTNDPLTKDEDESWSDWRGYQEVQVTTGAGTGRKTTKYWLYRGLDGDRTSKTDPSATKTVTVNDGDGNNYPDHAWLASNTLSTSLRDDTGTSHERTYHSYWSHTTASYDGLPDARFVRDSKTTTETAISSGWREHVVENEYDDNEAASTTFGLPMRTDDWGESNVSDNRCTTYGRAYNTDAYDSTGAQRWTVLPDQAKHYSVGCSSIADSNQDSYTSTLYDNSTAVADNHPVDGNPTEVRTYTTASAYRSAYTGYDKAGRITWSEDDDHNHTTIAYNPVNTWPLDGITTTSPDPDGPAAYRGPLTTTEWDSRYFGTPTQTKDANGKLTKTTLDAAGRTTEVWKPTETGSSPSMKFSYSIPTSTNSSGVPDAVDGYLHVTTRTLQSGSTYLVAHGYSDGLGRTRETQTPLPSDLDPATRQPVDYRQVAVTRYDSAGQATGTSAVFRNQGTAGTGGPSSPKVEDLPSYTDLVLDWAGRTTSSRLMVNGTVQQAGRVDTAYHGDYTSVTPVGGTATDTYTDVYGQTSKVVEHTQASAYTTTYDYNGTGQLTQITDPRSNNTRYTYDWAGQRTAVDDPDAGTSSTVYNNNGQISQTTGSVNNVQTTLTYHYDALGRKTSISSGADELAAWIWDGAGITNGKGHVTSTVSRDTDGTTYTTATGAFDARGRALNTTITLPASLTGLGRSYTASATYDAADHITSTTYPSAGGLAAETVTTTYDEYGHPTRLTSSLGNTVYVDGTTYDAYSRLDERNYGAEFSAPVHAQRAYDYDDSNGTRALKSIATTTTINELTTETQKDTYTYDLNGKLTELREQARGQTAQSQCFRYDDQDRLTLAYTHTTAGTCADTTKTTSDFKGTAPYQSAYTYDRLGNLQSVTDTDPTGKATTRDYLYPGYDDNGTWTTANADQPHGVRKINNIVSGTTTKAGTYTYYANGAMKQRVEGTTTTDYTWTKLEQLASAKTTDTGGSKLTRYTYDADGNLLVRATPTDTVASLGGTELRTTDGTKITGTRYYSLGANSVAMRTTEGNTTAGGKLTFLMGDTQASTQIAVDATAGTSTRRRYTPFGAQRSGSLPTGTSNGFLGKTEDTSTGLSLLGARAYDARLGRFLSPDPLNTPYDPQNLSAYSYSVNNPINYADPSGLAYVSPNGEKCGHIDQCHDTGGGTGGGGTGGGGSTAGGTGSGSTTSGSQNSAGHWGYSCIRGGICKRHWEQGAMGNDHDLVWGMLQGVVDTVTWGCNIYKLFGSVECASDAMRQEAADHGVDVTSVAYDNGTGIGGLIAALAPELLGARGGRIPNCLHSFVADTQVRLGDGSVKPMGDVKVGDMVTATDPETGKTEPRTVLQVIATRHDKKFVEVTVVQSGKRQG